MKHLLTLILISTIISSCKSQNTEIYGQALEALKQHENFSNCIFSDDYIVSTTIYSIDEMNNRHDIIFNNKQEDKIKLSLSFLESPDSVGNISNLKKVNNSTKTANSNYSINTNQICFTEVKENTFYVFLDAVSISNSEKPIHLHDEKIYYQFRIIDGNVQVTYSNHFTWKNHFIKQDNLNQYEKAIIFLRDKTRKEIDSGELEDLIIDFDSISCQIISKGKVEQEIDSNYIELNEKSTKSVLYCDENVEKLSEHSTDMYSGELFKRAFFTTIKNNIFYLVSCVFHKNDISYYDLCNYAEKRYYKFQIRDNEVVLLYYFDN